MKIHHCEQGGYEWNMLRVGKPTASCFDRILTSKKLEYAAGAVSYRNELLAELLTGAPLVSFESYWTERGHELEPKARAAYEFQKDVTVERVGFTTTDDGRVGYSPDGLVGNDGLLELKCPAPHTHVGYLLDHGSLKADYAHQCQGGLYVTGREWVDLCSYFPGMDPVVVRVTPDPKYQAALADALARFLSELDEAKAKLGIVNTTLQEAA